MDKEACYAAGARGIRIIDREERQGLSIELQLLFNQVGGSVDAVWFSYGRLMLVVCLLHRASEPLSVSCQDDDAADSEF